jgi:hypothetical protein
LNDEKKDKKPLNIWTSEKDIKVFHGCQIQLSSLWNTIFSGL